LSKTQKMLWAGCVVGLLGAVGAYFLGKEQERIRSLFGPAPRTISVADLATKGYGDNIWLDLTDVELGSKYVVGTRKGTMSAVWFPAFPRGQGEKATTIEVILRSTRCKTDADIVQHFAGRTSFRGAVINPTLLTPFDPYRPLLQQAYPARTLAPTVWEVDIDYTKPSTQWATGFYSAAMGLAVVGALGGLAGVGSFMSGPKSTEEDGSIS
jgi:hypothetical protein